MKKFSQKNKATINLPLCILIGIALAVAIKVFILDFYRVSGRSMEPSIKDNSLIAANKTAYGLQNPFKPELLFSWKKPKKGQKVLYMYQNYWVVKRCVAVSGDTLSYDCQNDKYYLIIDELKIPLTATQYHKLWTTKTVPEDFILAIGDNALLSHDSRDYGFVPIKNIVAKVLGGE